MPKKLREILSPKNDYVFKRIFGDSRHLAPLIAFLRTVLRLPAEEFDEVTIVDATMYPERMDGKRCILDVRIKTKSGHEIDVEIQNAPTSETCDRALYYNSRMVGDKVSVGEEYRDMPLSISIVIVDHRLWKSDERYNHFFRFYDVEAGLGYPNSPEIHTLELPKLPANSDGTELWDWLRFISSETRAEFESLAEKGGPMAEAVVKLMELSADDVARLQAEAQDKLAWDNAARWADGKAEGKAEGEAIGKARGKAEIVRRMLRVKKMAPSDIADLIGLSIEEVERMAEEEV